MQHMDIDVQACVAVGGCSTSCACKLAGHLYDDANLQTVNGLCGSAACCL